MFFVKVRRNEWLISTDSDNTSAYMKCLLHDENGLISSTIELKSYSRVILIDACKLDIYGHILSSDIYIVGSSKVKEPETPLPKSSKYLVQNLDNAIPMIHLRSFRQVKSNVSKYPEINLSRGATLAELAKANRQRSIVYKSDITKLQEESKNAEQVVYSKSLFDYLFGTWWQ